MSTVVTEKITKVNGFNLWVTCDWAVTSCGWRLSWEGMLSVVMSDIATTWKEVIINHFYLTLMMTSTLHFAVLLYLLVKGTLWRYRLWSISFPWYTLKLLWTTLKLLGLKSFPWLSVKVAVGHLSINSMWVSYCGSSPACSWDTDDFSWILFAYVNIWWKHSLCNW